MNKIMLVVILTVLSISGLYSQEKRFAFHITNPIGLYQKIGGKFEYRINQTGLLFGATQYYGSLPKMPGTQLNVEWRRYLKTNCNSLTKIGFIYTKLVGGHQTYVAERSNSLAWGGPFDGWSEQLAGNYYGGGAGIGSQKHFNHFFIEINTGLKYVYTAEKRDFAFYATGPGSVLDLHLLIGVAF